MFARKLFRLGILPILVLFLVAEGPAAAGGLGDSAEQPRLLLRTPEARAQVWRDGFLEFMAEHRGLTGEQAQAIENLAEIADRVHFAPVLQTHQKDLFNERLDELGHVLPYRDYLRALRSFDIELRVWLVRNSLASAASAAVLLCNCSGAGGCSGDNVCMNATCIHEGSTTHDGVCGSPDLANTSSN